MVIAAGSTLPPPREDLQPVQTQQQQLPGAGMHPVQAPRAMEFTLHPTGMELQVGFLCLALCKVFGPAGERGGL